MKQSLGFKAWFGFSIVAIAAVIFIGGGSALAGISTTKHNLGVNGATGDNHLSAGTAEICVFCHTPHGADTSAVVPLWNRVLGSGAGYTTYASLGTSTLDARTATNVGSVSIACLSCHDGSTAMDVMINQPGSGGYNPGGAAPAGWSWGAASSTMPAGITNIGTDLTNDHPIGIQYAGGGYTGSDVDASGGTAMVDKDFHPPQSAVLGSTRVWWVDTAPGTATTREKTDILLYTRGSSNGYAGQTDIEPFVECASCHDPHTANTTFLRIENDNSAVCLACHNK